MKADDDSSPAVAEIAQLRAEIASARQWMVQWNKDRRKMADLERQVDLLTSTVADLRSKPKANVAWIKASDAAVLGGGISMNQLARRRKDGTIPNIGWRQINSRVFEYRSDVILAALLA